MNKKIVFFVLFLILSCSTAKKITSDDLLYQSTPENLDKFGTFIWSKNEKDSIIFNKKNLNIIKSKKGMYFNSLIGYTIFLAEPEYKIENIDFSERSKILAYLIYCGEKIKVKETEASFMRSAVYYDRDLKFYNEFEKNNYYNLPGFKEEYRGKFERYKTPERIELQTDPPKIRSQN